MSGFGSVVNVSSPGNFVQLQDAPTSYVGQAGKIVTVKTTEDGVEFSSVAVDGGSAASVWDASLPTINGGFA